MQCLSLSTGGQVFPSCLPLLVILVFYGSLQALVDIGDGRQTLISESSCFHQSICFLIESMSYKGFGPSQSYCIACTGCPISRCACFLPARKCYRGHSKEVRLGVIKYQFILDALTQYRVWALYDEQGLVQGTVLLFVITIFRRLVFIRQSLLYHDDFQRSAQIAQCGCDTMTMSTMWMLKNELFGVDFDKSPYLNFSDRNCAGNVITHLPRNNCSPELRHPALPLFMLTRQSRTAEQIKA